jgi:hypothetical protein
LIAAADQSKSSTSCANETEETVFCRHIFECTQCGQRLAEEKTPQKEVAEPKWEKISPHKCSTEALDQTFKQPFVVGYKFMSHLILLNPKNFPFDF